MRVCVRVRVRASMHVCRCADLLVDVALGQGAERLVLHAPDLMKCVCVCVCVRVRLRLRVCVCVSGSKSDLGVG